MKTSTTLRAIALTTLPFALAAPQCGIKGDGNAFYTFKTVSSVAECVYTCENDSKCLSSQFKPSNSKCWLYGQSVAKAKTRNDNTGTYIFNDKGCPWVQCGLPADGSDFYKETQAGSTKECQSACKSDSRCRSSEFRFDNGKCWMYSKPVFQVKTQDKHGSHVFYDRDCPDIQCWVNGDGVKWYAMKTFSSARECLRACKEERDCLSSEYKQSNGNCWFFRYPVATAKTQDSTEHIFFDKDCSLEA